mgnify:CR=1 FL=1
MNRLNEFTPDIERLVENVYLGPQAEVLEMIESFNTQYIRGHNQTNYYYGAQVDAKPLGITKKFYWKPGAYPTIRQILNAIQRINMKAQTLTKVVSRARDYSYSVRNLQTNIENIEEKLRNFRSRGIRFQDNTNDIIEYWNVFYNAILEQMELCSDFAVFTVEDITNQNNELVDHRINVTYNYRDPKIKYKIAGQDDVLAEVECPGTVQISVRISLCKMLNKIASNNGTLDHISLLGMRNNDAPIMIGGRYYNEYGLNHPYIAAHGSSWGSSRCFTDTWRYVCVGNLDREIQGCFNSLDFLSLKVFIDRLITHYDTQTGPLNRIAMTYHGRPMFLEGSEDYYNIVSRLDRARHCNYTIELRNMMDNGLSPEQVKEESYCNKYCAIKNECSTYLSATETLSVEDLERRAIETATINAATRR